MDAFAKAIATGFAAFVLGGSLASFAEATPTDFGVPDNAPFANCYETKGGSFLVTKCNLEDKDGIASATLNLANGSSTKRVLSGCPKTALVMNGWDDVQGDQRVKTVTIVDCKGIKKTVSNVQPG